ncbi:MAG: hypothetical protein IIB57_11150, partial [Planctomycetes bacterium]|nr:hypothetical protein [Planctomycetota bacterium]
QFDGFFEEQCLSYAIDIQAVVGHKFVDDGFGACIEESTGESWDEDVWGWHSTTTEIGAAFGLGPALQTVVTMDGKDWFYGPWGPVDITCGQRNMAFELITDTPNEEDPDADGDGVPDVCNISLPEIRFLPIRSAPLGSPVGTIGDPVTPVFNGALGCWEVFVPGGVGVEVDLDLQAFGWGNAVGSPTLGAIVATVVSAGYDNGVGGDLNPKGWPGSPDDGAYQATRTCESGGGGEPCSRPFDATCVSQGGGICVWNPDWVMPACALDLPAMATPTLDYVWATAAQVACNIDDGLVKTMGGLILEVPENAFGTYVIDLNPDPNKSFMTSGAGTPIADLTLTPACITTVCEKAAPPAIDCWTTACDGSTQYDFVQNVIPADFFGPGSDPFDGFVSLGGASGGADTQIQRLDGMCFDGSLPVTRTTDIEIVQLDLISCDPITVTFNGGQDPEDWIVVVQLVAPQTLGTLTPIKTDDDGGTYTADIPVNAQFVFERVSDGQTEGPLSAGNITLSTTVPAPWRQSGCTGSCAAAGFCPGLTTDQNGEPCCEPTCHEGPAPGHEHCTIPPDCPACPPPVEPPIRAPAPHDILKNRYISIDPRGASGNNPSSHHIRVTLVSSLVNGQAGNGPWWAEQPDAACISMVTTTKPASEPDWSACPVLHLTGCPIIPTSTYALAVESGGNLSADALFDTQAKPGTNWHGDCVGIFTGTEWTAPNGVTSIDDAVAAIKTFQVPTALPGCGAPPCNATHTSVTDMEPNLTPGPQINKVVNIADVFSIIKGFQGFEYPGPDLTQCP